MKISEKLKEKLARLKHRSPDQSLEDENGYNEPGPENDENPDTQNPDEETSEDFDDSSDTSMEQPDEIADADKASSVKKKHIMVGVGCVGVFLVAMIASNAFFKGPNKQAKDPPLTTAMGDMKNNPNNPAAGMPDKYSDITKYQNKSDPKNAKKTPPQANKINPTYSSTTNAARDSAPRTAPTRTRVSSSGPSESSGASAPAPRSSSNPAASRAQQKADQEAAKRQQIEEKAIASAIAFSQAVSNSASANNGTASAANSSSKASASVSGSSDSSSLYDDIGGGEYALQAGSVVQATLITGITSDVPNGDVVAQVRQNIYDSETGEHLLIPQGSRLIGKSGSAGSRGNARIGVVFSRIILPNGQSITLPDQQAIDGVGYPGLKDQYTQHSGKLYSTAFMTALISAAAQSATGNSSGSDDRSPGQEAVSGAVADVLDAMKDVINRDSSVNPTITIRPGSEFSVFINQDLYIPEYTDE